MTRARVSLSTFDNSWFFPGRSIPVRLVWLLVNRVFFQTTFPWPSRMKAAILRRFGATVGVGVVIKPRVNIKYPWHLAVGDASWIGEGVWIDSLGRVDVGANCCLSQGVMVETGNHNWASTAFDLIIKPVVIEDGAWAAVKSLLLPGSRLATHAILGAGSVLSGETEPYGIYAGVPAELARKRLVHGETTNTLQR